MDPWQRFRQQPWLPLFQVAGVTLLLATAVDILLFLGATHIPAIAQSLNLLLSISFLMPVIAGLGIGALSVHLCERWQPQLYLNLGRLWALVLCSAVCLAVKTLLPFLPHIFVWLTYPTVLGIILGTFWRSRQHWR